MRGLLTDVRFALRRLRAAPGFTVFAIASLALAIGFTTVAYSAVRTLMWRPLAVPHADSLIGIRNGRRVQAASWLDFQDFRQQQTSFSAVAASLDFPAAVGAGTGSQTLRGEAVSGAYFEVVGVRALQGRLLTDADEASSARVVVVSEYFWRKNLQGDRAPVGRILKLGGEPFELVGVIDGGFHGLDPFYPDSIWVPVSALSSNSEAFRLPRSVFDRRDVALFDVWARLRKTADFGHASAEVALIGRRLDAAYPLDPSRTAGRQWRLQPDGAMTPDNETRDTIVFMILGGLGAVLLIACTNLANLALASGTSRAQEITVRYALGASRWQLVRAQLLETLIIVMAGGFLGIVVMLTAVGYWAVDLAFAPGLALRFPEVDASVFVASLSGMVLALGVFGLWPAMQSTRADIRSGLGAGPAASPKWALHRSIVAWQVCGSVALLLVTFLTVKVIQTSGRGMVSRTAHGDLALAEVDFGLNGQDEAHMRLSAAAILEGARGHGGVRAVAASNALPFGWFTFRPRDVVSIGPDERTDAEHGAVRTPIIAATPSFFSTVGMHVLKGRDFTAGDDAAAPPVLIVSEAAARALFRTTDVVGTTVYLRQNGNADGRPSELITLHIVGVCNDEPTPFAKDAPRPVAYVPFAQRYQKNASILFLARGETPEYGVAALRSSVQRLDPDLAITIAGTGNVVLDGPMLLLRIIIAMTTALGTLALVLSMAGLFGVLSHVVTKRTREIGIRLALGAERSDIFRLILGDGVRPVVKGLVFGLGIGVAARLTVRAYVVTDVSALDPLPLLLLPVPFTIAGVIASYLPAARASRVDPNVALRDL